ncbi:MAG: bile acid:sodium symporter family protein, partial [Bacteroidales bacterium]|nr:bile acid:sodium symporter family protein [Bacteroidales bacterium]
MKILGFIKKYMAVIVLLVALVSLIEPSSFSWVKTKYINWMLGIIMLCMGVSLKPSAFKIVFSHPKNVCIGCLSQ